jgi:hypothetical protein
MHLIVALAPGTTSPVNAPSSGVTVYSADGASRQARIQFLCGLALTQPTAAAPTVAKR